MVRARAVRSDLGVICHRLIKILLTENNTYYHISVTIITNTLLCKYSNTHLHILNVFVHDMHTHLHSGLPAQCNPGRRVRSGKGEKKFGGDASCRPENERLKVQTQLEKSTVRRETATRVSSRLKQITEIKARNDFKVVFPVHLFVILTTNSNECTPMFIYYFYKAPTCFSL
jgi:hypothetical protein